MFRFDLRAVGKTDMHIVLRTNKKISVILDKIFLILYNGYIKRRLEGNISGRLHIEYAEFLKRPAMT